MTILAIETSCDETAASVIINGKIKSNIIASQAFQLHARYGGIVPEVAAREHVSVIIPTINLALKQAHIKLANIEYVAVTQGPGLATSLMVGVDTAKALGLGMGKPVIPINHLEAHMYANFIEDKIKLPAIALIVSGGHTMLVQIKKHGAYHIIGETVDDAAGEAFDKTARMLGLGYPGGAKLSELAEKGNSTAYNFPRPMINSGNFEFSFSGLKTAVLYKMMERKTWNKKQKADLAASVQQAIIDVLVSKLEKAIMRYKPKSILLGGGVAANKLLRAEFAKLGKKYKITASIPKFEYCTDNAAMIGLTAHYRIKNKQTKVFNFVANPNLPLK